MNVKRTLFRIPFLLVIGAGILLNIPDLGAGDLIFTSSKNRGKDNGIAYLMIEGSGIAIRARPTVDSEAVGSVPKSGFVDVLENNVEIDMVSDRLGAWCKVKYNGVTGYMFDGWLAHEEEVGRFVKTFITDIGEQNLEKAFYAQNFLSRNTFMSQERGYGGVVETKVMSEPEVRRYNPTVLQVRIKYLALDSVNDSKFCSSPGIVYHQLFKVKKVDSGFVIVGTDLLDRKCQN